MAIHHWSMFVCVEMLSIVFTDHTGAKRCFYLLDFQGSYFSMNVGGCFIINCFCPIIWNTRPYETCKEIDPMLNLNHDFVWGVFLFGFWEILKGLIGLYIPKHNWVWYISASYQVDRQPRINKPRVYEYGLFPMSIVILSLVDPN